MVCNIVSDVLFHYCLCTLISTSKTLQSCSVCLSSGWLAKCRHQFSSTFSPTFPSLQSCSLIWMELFGVEIPNSLYFYGLQDNKILYIFCPQKHLGSLPILWILHAPSDMFLCTVFGKVPPSRTQPGPCCPCALLCSSKKTPCLADVIILLELDIVCDLRPMSCLAEICASV